MSFWPGSGEGGRGREKGVSCVTRARDIPFSISEDKDNKADYVLKFTQSIWILCYIVIKIKWKF